MVEDQDGVKYLFIIKKFKIKAYINRAFLDIAQLCSALPWGGRES